MTVKQFIHLLASVKGTDDPYENVPVQKIIDALADYPILSQTVTEDMMANLTNNQYTQVFEGEESVIKRPWDNKTAFFVRVAHDICFSDCCGDLDVRSIIFHGKQYEYQGWEPGMVYRFVSEDGDEWVGRFPEWDH